MIKKKFVIFGMGRTGSSLLATLMLSHPRVRCEGEIFRPLAWRRSLRSLCYLWQLYPMPYLAYRYSCANLLRGKDVYGFKLHAKLDGDQIIHMERFLRHAAQQGWKIIHLRREELFDQLISELAANQTKRYFGHTQGPEPEIQFTISPDKFSTNLKQLVAISQRNQHIMATIPHLPITYEQDLASASDWEATLARICDYLEISRATHVKSIVTKPWSRPYADIVVNYADLHSIYQAYTIGQPQFAYAYQEN